VKGGSSIGAGDRPDTSRRLARDTASAGLPTDRQPLDAPSGVEAGVGGMSPACATTTIVAADAAVIIGREAASRLRC
jgi:hypothetical protein